MKKVLLSLTLLAGFMAMASFTGEGGKKLPSVMVEDLSGKKVNVNTFSNDGKPFIVNVWATWCSPCKRELNTIHEVYEDWVDETGVKMIAISMDDSRNKHKVKPYVLSKGWEYECYIDPNSDFVRAMQVVNPPQTFLFNGNGEMVWQHNGYSPGDEDELLEQVKHLLKK